MKMKIISFFIPLVLSVEGVYLAFRVLRCLLLNTLSVTYSKGYTDTNSKLSILASIPGGQKKPGLVWRMSAATISLVGVSARLTWRTPRPFLVVSANGDSTTIVSENSRYSDRNNLRILLPRDRPGGFIPRDAFIGDFSRAARKGMVSRRADHLWDSARTGDFQSARGSSTCQLPNRAERFLDRNVRKKCICSYI